MLLSILLNAGAWALIQLGLAAAASHLSDRMLVTQSRGWERRGRFYSSLGIRAWKDKLPDGGSWFAGGFSKRHLRGRGVVELERFARETTRGEIVHWLAIAALPSFALWNSWPAMLVNATYAIAANLPCILVQRYIRARIAPLLRPRTRQAP